MNAEGLIWCPKCKQWLHEEKFHMYKGSVTGHACHCKVCIRTERGSVDRATFDARRSRVSQDGFIWCPRCKQYKGRSEFSTLKRAAIGVSGICKECHKAEANQYSANPETFLTRVVRYAQQHSKDGRRTKAPKEFTLPPDWAVKQWGVQLGLCYYTGLPMTTRPGHHRTSPYVASIDRVDNSQGYTPENCVLCCWKANSMKGPDDLATLEVFCKALLNRGVPLSQVASDPTWYGE